MGKRHIIEHQSPASPDEELNCLFSSNVSDWREIIAESNYFMMSTPLQQSESDSSFDMEETLSIQLEENKTSGFFSMSQTCSFNSTMVEDSQNNSISESNSINKNNSINENNSMDKNKENVPQENELNILSQFEQNIEVFIYQF